MAYESNIITVIGNLTDDPELRYTPNGTPVTNFRVAVNRKYTTKDGQQQEETAFIGVNVWRDLAENVGESLHKGDRAIVIGYLKQRSYEAKEGHTVWVTEIEADEVAPSLKWARASVTKSSGGSSSGAPTPQPADDDVPF